MYGTWKTYVFIIIRSRDFLLFDQSNCDTSLRRFIKSSWDSIVRSFFNSFVFLLSCKIVSRMIKCDRYAYNPLCVQPRLFSISPLTCDIQLIWYVCDLGYDYTCFFVLWEWGHNVLLYICKICIEINWKQRKGGIWAKLVLSFIIEFWNSWISLTYKSY